MITSSELREWGEMDSDDECMCSKALRPLKRYAVFYYANDWDGWAFQDSFDSRDEAEQFAERIHAHAWDGVIVCEVVVQHIAPSATRYAHADQQAARQAEYEQRHEKTA